MLHALKTWPEYYKAIESGEKTFEIRKEDRPFNTGDTVVLQEFDPATEKFTGKERDFTISYILKDAVKLGLKQGFVILGLKDKE